MQHHDSLTGYAETLSVSEVAEVLGGERTTVYRRLIWTGVLRVCKGYGHNRILRAEVTRFLDSSRTCTDKTAAVYRPINTRRSLPSAHPQATECEVTACDFERLATSASVVRVPRHLLTNEAVSGRLTTTIVYDDTDETEVFVSFIFDPARNCLIGAPLRDR